MVRYSVGDNFDTGDMNMILPSTAAIQNFHLSINKSFLNLSYTLGTISQW